MSASFQGPPGTRPSARFGSTEWDWKSGNLWKTYDPQTGRHEMKGMSYTEGPTREETIHDNKKKYEQEWALIEAEVAAAKANRKAKATDKEKGSGLDTNA